MQRESYWDYMGRRMREERNSMYDTYSFQLKSTEKELANLVKLFQRVKELERKVIILGGDPRQLELDV